MQTFADKALSKSKKFPYATSMLVGCIPAILCISFIVLFPKPKSKLDLEYPPIKWKIGPPVFLTINGSRWVLEAYDFYDDPDSAVRDSKGNVIGHTGATTSCTEHKIWYDPNVPSPLIKDNLWHEVFHAELCNENDDTIKTVSGVKSLSHDHCLVYQLGMSNSVFVHDNPAFIKWAEGLELKKPLIETVPAPKLAKKRGRPAKPKLVVVPVAAALPNGLVLGCLVRYYEGGWRFGYLEEVKANTAWVTPVAAYKANPGRHVSTNLYELQREDNVR